MNTIYKLKPGCRLIKENQIEYIIKSYNDGLSVYKIAEELGFTRYQSIVDFLIYNGLRNAHNRIEFFNSIRQSDKIDINLIRKYISEGKTRKEMAVLLNCSVSLIKTVLKNNNIRMVPYETKHYRHILVQNKQAVIEKYEEVENLEAVGKMFGCSGDSIAKFFNSIKYEYIIKRNYDDLLPELESIKKLYYEENKHLMEIAKIYRCSYVKISYFLKMHGCIIKSRSEIMRNHYKDDNFYKKCMSGSGRNKHYTLPSGKIINLRGYEPNFLDFVFKYNILKEGDIIISPERIKYVYNGKEHFYYPDFYIPKLNLIVETKSSWILRKQGIDKNIAKEKYTTHNGFEFIMIVDNDFSKFSKLITQ